MAKEFGSCLQLFGVVQILVLILPISDPKSSMILVILCHSDSSSNDVVREVDLLEEPSCLVLVEAEAAAAVSSTAADVVFILSFSPAAVSMVSTPPCCLSRLLFSTLAPVGWPRPFPISTDDKKLSGDELIEMLSPLHNDPEYTAMKQMNI